MSEHQQADDVQHAFRIVITAIGAIVVLGIALLIAVVLVYRTTPGRHFPFAGTTPTVASPQPPPS